MEAQIRALILDNIGKEGKGQILDLNQGSLTFHYIPHSDSQKCSRSISWGHISTPQMPALPKPTKSTTNSGETQ